MPVVFPTTTIKSVATFLDQNLDEYDPDTVIVTVNLPDGTSVIENYDSPSVFPPIGITRLGLGNYQLEYDATQAGLFSFIWYGEVTSTGVKVTQVGTLRVSPVDQGS